MSFRLLLILTLTVYSANAQSIIQSSNEYGRLPWVNGELPPNKSFINYKVIYVEGNSLNDARDRALSLFLTDVGKDRGVTVSSSTVNRVKETISNQSPSFFETSTSRELKVSFEDYDIAFTKVDEYYEVTSEGGGRNYRLWHLYALDGYPEFQSLSYTYSYGITTTLKSALVPGWGQFEKKHTTKGILFLAGEVAAVGVMLKANNDYNYNVSRRDEAQSLDLKKAFQKEADNSLALRNISLAGAAAIWIYNIIDAASPNGAPKYAFNDNLRINLTSNTFERLAINLKYKFK
jgi:hypothetical protein